MKRTKIVITLGPSTDDLNVIENLLLKGADVARINFSHGLLEDHVRRLKLFREAANKVSKRVAVIADLQGPKLRIGSFLDNKINLSEGDQFCLDFDCPENQGNQDRVAIFEPSLLRDLSKGSMLLLDDGAVSLQVINIEHRQIYCKVIVGGCLSNNKGINLQGGGLSAPSLTKKDYKDIESIVKMDIDYIALSFVKSQEDVKRARDILNDHNSNLSIISKLECAEVMDCLDEIIQVSDAIMVARGDLAVEIGPGSVPMAQKQMIKKAREYAKPVIVATQMMESMVWSKKPTRAETSDVANAVLDGTDAIMMSSETAVGDHPALVVEVAADICIAAESYLKTLDPTSFKKNYFSKFDEAIAMAAIYTSSRVDIKAIVVLTESGQTPLWMSRARSDTLIYALSRHPSSCQKMALYRGVTPVYFDMKLYESYQLANEGINVLKSLGYLAEGDHVILTKGDNHLTSGKSNTLKILKVS